MTYWRMGVRIAPDTHGTGFSDCSPSWEARVTDGNCTRSVVGTDGPADRVSLVKEGACDTPAASAKQQAGRYRLPIVIRVAAEQTEVLPRTTSTPDLKVGDLGLGSWSGSSRLFEARIVLSHYSGKQPVFSIDSFHALPDRVS